MPNSVQRDWRRVAAAEVETEVYGDSKEYKWM